MLRVGWIRRNRVGSLWWQLGLVRSPPPPPWLVSACDGCSCKLLTLTVSSSNIEISFLSSPCNSLPKSFSFTSSHDSTLPQVSFTLLMRARVCGTKYLLSERTFTVLPTFKITDDMEVFRDY